MKITLIDADSLVYGLAYRTKDLPKEEFKLALKGVLDDLDNILSGYENSVISDTYIGLLGKERTNRRVQISSNNMYNWDDHVPYKGIRTPIEWYDLVKDTIINYLTRFHNFYLIWELEVDDVMSLMYYMLKDKHDVLLAHIDKDLNQIPGDHLNYRTNEFYQVTPEEAEYSFWKQMLMGDSTDNIPGIPKIGEKKAEKFLNSVKNSDNYKYHVLKKYTEYYGEHKGVLKYSENYYNLRMPDKCYNKDQEDTFTEIIKLTLNSSLVTQ